MLTRQTRPDNVPLHRNLTFFPTSFCKARVNIQRPMSLYLCASIDVIEITQI